MPTRAQLLKLADEAASSAAEHGRLREMMLEQERQLRAMAESMGTNEVLHVRRVTSRVNSQMHSEHRLAIAKGQAKTDKKFKAALRAKGFSQGGLARAVDIQPSLLSMYRTGERKIPLSRAKRIEELTGWSASSWPGVVSDA